MSSFSRSAFIQATLKAPGEIVNGKRSGVMTDVATVFILPLMPASNETVNRVQLQTPTDLLETYFEASAGLQAKEGFVLSVSGVLYPVKDLSAWPYEVRPNNGLRTYQIVVEDLRNK